MRSYPNDKSQAMCKARVERHVTLTLLSVYASCYIPQKIMCASQML